MNVHFIAASRKSLYNIIAFIIQCGIYTHKSHTCLIIGPAGGELTGVALKPLNDLKLLSNSVLTNVPGNRSSGIT